MTHKVNRMSSEIGKEISLIIQNKLNNPNIDPFTSVSEVLLSKDIKYATVYVLVPAGGNAEKTVKALSVSAGFIKRELSLVMRELRTVPSLRFIADTSSAYGQKIDSLLKDITYGDSDE